jgi:hypothetical protein
MDKPYLTVHDLRARYPQASERTLARWSRTGILPEPDIRVGGVRFWRPEVIEAFAPKPDPSMTTRQMRDAQANSQKQSRAA